MRMYAMQSGGAMPTFPLSYTLVVNHASPLVARLGELSQTDTQKANLMASQIYRLAVLAQRKLSAEELNTFLTESFALLAML